MVGDLDVAGDPRDPILLRAFVAHPALDEPGPQKRRPARWSPCGPAFGALATARYAAGRDAEDYFRWFEISLVISNIDTCAFLKISFSLASALIIRRLTASCSLFFLM